MVAQSAPAEDREARLKKKIQNLESTVSQLSESISEIMTHQISTARENNENHQKLAQKLNDIKQPSNPARANRRWLSRLPKKQKRPIEKLQTKKEQRKFFRHNSIKEYHPIWYSTNGRERLKRAP